MQLVICSSFHVVPEVLKRFRVTTTKHHLVIPLQDSAGCVMGTVYLRKDSRIGIPNERSYSIGTKLPQGFLYNADSVRTSRKCLILTVGIPSVWKLWLEGFPNVVGILTPSIGARAIDSIKRLVTKTGCVWVITNGNSEDIYQGLKVAGKLAGLRNTRHAFKASKRVVDCTSKEILDMFTHP